MTRRLVGCTRPAAVPVRSRGVALARSIRKPLREYCGKDHIHILNGQEGEASAWWAVTAQETLFRRWELQNW